MDKAKKKEEEEPMGDVAAGRQRLVLWQGWDGVACSGCVQCTWDEEEGTAAMSRMWPSVRSCADVSGCRSAGAPWPHAQAISGGRAAPTLLCALFC